jgi:uridine kinase
MAQVSMVHISDELASRLPKVGTTKFIAVDGHGGSGKSSLADILAKKLDAQLIHTDDFASWDNPLNWWTVVIERVFDPIEAGVKTLSYPRSKWWPGHHPEPVVDQPVTPVMILEGVSSLRKEFRPYISYGIFVDTPEDVCLERGIARDLSTGKSRQDLVKTWQGWLKDENDYLQRDQPQAYADLVLDGTKPFEDQI